MHLAARAGSYFGGNAAHRGNASIEMLAKCRLVMIEKWEGHCWQDCLAQGVGSPSCCTGLPRGLARAEGTGRAGGQDTHRQQPEGCPPSGRGLLAAHSASLSLPRVSCRCEAGCDVEAIIMDTLRRVKTINPGVCGVMYLNTLLAFPFYKLNGSVFSTALPLPPNWEQYAKCITASACSYSGRFWVHVC